MFQPLVISQIHFVCFSLLKTYLPGLDRDCHARLEIQDNKLAACCLSDTVSECSCFTL